jgi:hypothetical protein
MNSKKPCVQPDEAAAALGDVAAAGVAGNELARSSSVMCLALVVLLGVLSAVA